MSELVWLASFPKSGNTWVRAIVTAYSADGPVDLAHLESDSGLQRDDIDALAGIETSDLPLDVLIELIPELYRAHAARLDAVTWAKTHDRHTIAGSVLHPPEITRGAVYIVRDPRDVVVSYADHMGQSLDESIADLADDGLVLARSARATSAQRPQPVGRWSDHVTGWVDGGLAPVVVRYEDLIADAAGAAAPALAAAGLDVDHERLARAVAAARFEVLSASEAAHGFRERARGQERFFRSGRAGGWRDVLSPSQARRIVDHHGAVMERLGYDTRGV